MSSVSGISLAIFGILVVIGSMSGWFYLAYYCNPVAYNQIGANETSRAINSCLTFYTATQLKGQGLASYPPMISVASFVFGIILLICGTVLIAVKQN